MIYVLQADNRLNLKYLKRSQQVNQRFCTALGYTYVFKHIQECPNCPSTMHPATKKIYVVHQFLQENMQDNTCNKDLKNNQNILVFLDSDAWIQNGKSLDLLLQKLRDSPTKHGLFSRDPYLVENTYINSGSFVLKIDKYTMDMYSKLLQCLQNDHSHYNVWPFDQYYISKYVYENKKDFEIFIPNVLNCPDGKVLRHNWLKNRTMYFDLDSLLKKKDILEGHFVDLHEYDSAEFPNTISSARISNANATFNKALQ